MNSVLLMLKFVVSLVFLFGKNLFWHLHAKNDSEVRLGRIMSVSFPPHLGGKSPLKGE